MTRSKTVRSSTSFPTAHSIKPLAENCVFHKNARRLKIADNIAAVQQNSDYGYLNGAKCYVKSRADLLASASPTACRETAGQYFSV
jgi:hypothetical protein